MTCSPMSTAGKSHFFGPRGAFASTDTLDAMAFTSTRPWVRRPISLEELCETDEAEIAPRLRRDKPAEMLARPEGALAAVRVWIGRSVGGSYTAHRRLIDRR